MINLKTKATNERIWVTRSSGGEYSSHFFKHNIAAIGHLDRFNFCAKLKDKNELTFSEKTLEELFAGDADMTKGQRTSHRSQVSQFINEMKIGDLMVTLNSSVFAIGRITGHPYFDNSPFPIQVGRELKALPHQLRMPVQWGSRYSRQNLPLPLERVLFSHRTVFEISDYWQYIYHILYPAFVDGDDLYLSLLIGQASDIRTKDIGGLINILREFEALAAELGDDSFVETLTLKASFFSKGPFWPKLKAKEKKAALYTALVYLFLSGGEIGPLKLNGILNTEAAKIFATQLGEIMKKNSGAQVQNGLILSLPPKVNSGVDQESIEPVNTQTILWASV